MNQQERDIGYILDMIEHAEHSLTFVEGMALDEFAGDLKSQFATVRSLEIIGEAAKSVSEELKSLHPEVPWRQMTRMRDKLVHHYFAVDIEVVWSTTREDLNPLIAQLNQILSRLRTSLGEASSN